MARPPEEDPQGAVLRWIQTFADPALTWADLAWLREQTALPVLVKGGLNSATRALALELAPHTIRVNCIAPVLIAVEGEVSPISEEYKSTLTRSLPSRRSG